VRTNPDYAAFAETYDAGKPQVAWTEFIADLETPVSAMLKLAEGRRNSFLLESVSGGSIRGRAISPRATVPRSNMNASCGV